MKSFVAFVRLALLSPLLIIGVGFATPHHAHAGKWETAVDTNLASIFLANSVEVGFNSIYKKKWMVGYWFENNFLSQFVPIPLFTTHKENYHKHSVDLSYLIPSFRNSAWTVDSGIGFLIADMHEAGYLNTSNEPLATLTALSMRFGVGGTKWSSKSAFTRTTLGFEWFPDFLAIGGKDYLAASGQENIEFTRNRSGLWLNVAVGLML